MKPYVVNAAIKRPDGVYWRTLAYCSDCGVRMGLTFGTPAWTRVKIALPEFRRTAICFACIERRHVQIPDQDVRGLLTMLRVMTSQRMAAD